MSTDRFTVMTPLLDPDSPAWIMDRLGEHIATAHAPTPAERQRIANQIAEALNLTSAWPAGDDARSEYFGQLRAHLDTLEALAEVAPEHEAAQLREIATDLEFAAMRIMWLEEGHSQSSPIKTLWRRAFLMIGREPSDIINTAEADWSDKFEGDLPAERTMLADKLCELGLRTISYNEDEGEEWERDIAFEAIRFDIPVQADNPAIWLRIRAVIAEHEAICRAYVASLGERPSDPPDCPVSDPDCTGGDGDCHDACESGAMRSARLAQEDIESVSSEAGRVAAGEAGGAESSPPASSEKVALAPQEASLIEWLSREDSSTHGECNGTCLDRLISLGLAILGPPDDRGDLYRAVSLTEAGRKLASELAR